MHTSCGRAVSDDITHGRQLKQHHVAAMLMLQRSRSCVPTHTAHEQGQHTSLRIAARVPLLLLVISCMQQVHLAASLTASLRVWFNQTARILSAHHLLGSRALNYTQIRASEPGQASLSAERGHNPAQQALTWLPGALLPVAWLAILRPATKAA